MTVILTIALPIFAVIATGFASGRFGIIHSDDGLALNRFVFNIAMPVAIFGLTSRTDPLTPSDLSYSGIYLIASLATLGISYMIARRIFSLPRPDAGVHAFASTLGNAVFLGLPIAQNITDWGRPFIVLMLAEGLIIITLASILIAARVDEEKTTLKTRLLEILLRPFKNPLVLGTLSGFIFGLTGLPLPNPVSAFLDILGRAAGPTALFSLGLFLSANSIKSQKIFSAQILQIASFKMILLPILMLVGLHIIGINDRNILGASMLFTLVPAGIGVYIQASARGRYAAEAATAIIVTTVASILTVNATLYFLA